MKIRTFSAITLITFASFSIIGCAEGGQTPSKVETKKEPVEVEKKESNLFEISGKVFSIPSPIQTAFLLKEAGTQYESSVLNTTDNLSNYSTNFQKAVALGIYGADLGYVTIYDQTQDAISYMTATKRLAADLGIDDVFDESMLSRFEQNIGNQDSLLVMVSDAFKSADGYLKENKQNDISVMILAGGWIETLHFATQVAATSANEKVVNRIGEQKITIKNLVNLLAPFNENPQVADLANQLNELKGLYDGIEYTYSYSEPSVDVENKTTTINSTSSVQMSDEQLASISDKINAIRSSLIK